MVASSLRINLFFNIFIMKKIILKISGMTCASCVKLNESAILAVEGVSSANVNIATNKAVAEFDEKKTNLEKIIQSIEKAGYGAKEMGEHDHDHSAIENEQEGNKTRKRFIGSALLTLPVFSMMFTDELTLGINFFGVDLLMWIYATLTAVVVFGFGWHFHRSAGKKLLHLSFNMDSLVSLGTLTALSYSVWAMLAAQAVYFEAAAAIITLINLGKWLEARSKGRAGQALQKLLELGVKKARVIRGDKEFEISVEEIKVGDILHVKAGEKIPLDGVIVSGEAALDESMLTGESIPVTKKSGDEVFGATLNQNGSIKIRTTKIGGDTVLAQIIKMVEEAQGSKAPIQKLADKIAGIFVPIVMAIALVTFLVWYFISGELETSIIPAVAVLVIACPCALGLATPTAIMVGTGTGAKQGILIKNGETLEKSNKIDMVIFDKTGTLTEGKPQVTDIIPFDFPKEKLLKIAYGLAQLSHHPLSQTIAKFGEEQKVVPAKLTSFREVSGQGVLAKCEEHKTDLRLGNEKMMQAGKIEISSQARDTVQKLATEGKTPLLISHGNQLVGILGLMDTVKPDSAKAIQQLNKLGIETVMLTGDNRQTAEAIAKSLGIRKVIAEVLPQDKSMEVQKIQQAGKRVAFVGDGINDAPALAQADLGIAMGTGSDIAIETGSIVLMQGSPAKVFSALRLSQKTFSIIKQNLFWAFIYNVIGIPIAALGLLNPIFASFAMSMSSVSVVSNSLRIKKFH
jgi:P-type Cu+ transporter